MKKTISPSTQYRGRMAVAERMGKSPRSVSLYMRKGYLTHAKIDGTTLIFTEAAVLKCLKAVEKAQEHELKRRQTPKNKRTKSGAFKPVATTA